MKTLFLIISLFVFVSLQGQLTQNQTLKLYEASPTVWLCIDSIKYHEFKDAFIHWWNKYEKECYKDSVKVCKFACYTLAEDGDINYWGEFDCEYYREYQSIYYCTDRYNKWIHLNEPTLKGFIEYLKNK